MTSPIRTKKFETFVMTGDAIIKTRSVSPHLSLGNNQSKSSDVNSVNRRNKSSKDPNCLKGNSELDIPPDDISSEDELYEETSVVDVECLPPPPDDFFAESPSRVGRYHEVAEKQSILADEVAAFNQLNRHRSYDSFTVEGKPQETEKPQTLRASPEATDHLKNRNNCKKSSAAPAHTPEEDESQMNFKGLLLESAFPCNSLSRNSKDADLPSAQRLAKRLFTLDGFQQVDVAKHLGKKDSFSALVGQEYLKHFKFTGQKLDAALRSFLNNLTLVGETQERERILDHFSHRYVECNVDFVLSEDSCHTLICAMMLLNIDHHSQNVAKKMTFEEFAENLSMLNDGEDYPQHLLWEVYRSVCDDPFKCPTEAKSPSTTETIGNNPFLSTPDSSDAREYKRGFVMRKCCVDPDGRKTSFGKRGWRMFHATLKDLVLYLHKDEHGMKRHASADHQHHHNAIRVHHALAERALDYVKKQHVFRLTTCNSAQYLFQTSDNGECQSWVDCINFVAASLSSAPLPSAVGSQKKFQRPLMPSSRTKLNVSEQRRKLRESLVLHEDELEEHRRQPPDKGGKSRAINEYLEKENFLSFEVKRFKIYTSLLQPQELTFEPLPRLPDNALADAVLQDVMEECNPHSCEESRSKLSGVDLENFQRSYSDRPISRPAFSSS